jgi:hypothetical protein
MDVHYQSGFLDTFYQIKIASIYGVHWNVQMERLNSKVTGLMNL